ncbi:myosin vii xv [Anaeramoeba flamelloides]|uniref:Myosin vii xv n=1 Tax=Anaeramoeba flamelloides TaxID=1746091 RepID=A0AAV7ZM11_9EUKA|nr:myosin vii xv [Anaeramoeba flamelloides]
MGDAQSIKQFKTADDLQVAQLGGIKRILQNGIDHPELRDEIYVQICKQTSRNPNPQSNLRGWGALCLVSQTFPPSEALKRYISKFLNYYSKSDYKATLDLQNILETKSSI